MSEPYIVTTYRGYTAAVDALDMETNELYELLISGIKSLADGIEPIREANDGLFTGVKIKIKKESSERTSPYLVELDDNGAGTGSARSYPTPHAPGLEGPISAEERLWQRISSNQSV